MIDVGQAVIGFFMMLGLMALGLHVAVAVLITISSGACVHGTDLKLRQSDVVDHERLSAYFNSVIRTFGRNSSQSGVTDRMYKTLSLWLAPLLADCFIPCGASSIFAAVSGSSVATAATISTVALPEFRKRRYNEKLVLGSIASGATAILIPPSVNLIIFGALTNTSIGQLFVGGIIPGVCLTLLFMLSIILIAKMFPGTAETVTKDTSMSDKVEVWCTSSRHCDLCDMGAIYFGWATPASSGVVSSCPWASPPFMVACRGKCSTRHS